MYKLVRKSSLFFKPFTTTSKLVELNSHSHKSTKPQNRNSNLDFITISLSNLQSSKQENEVSHAREPSHDNSSSKERTVQLSHPWPEWVDLMECLLKKGYFEEAQPIVSLNWQLGGKDANHIRTACLTFARDCCDLIRYLSRKDIHVISGCGCPSTDRKVVNSGKRLRAHVKIDEGTVCSSCSLRGNCERAYKKPREDECGRTVDVMRILLTYGLDPITESVENKPLNKMTKESVRRLLKEMVEHSSERLDSDHPGAGSSESRPLIDHLSEYGQGRIKVPMKQGDWQCPKCNFLNFARNIKCLNCNALSEEKIIRIREDQEHLPRKKGDWICDKCNFLNFAKNTRCLLCKEKPSQRHLNPGEWECESCNYINFRKNMVCLKCDHRRQKARSTSTIPPQPDCVENHKSSRFMFVTGGHEASNKDCTEQEMHEPQKYTSKNKMIIFKNEDRGWDPHNDDCGFVDFPVLGGNSELSQDAQKRESWKLKMLEKNDKEERAQEADDDLSTLQRRAYFLVSSDDEDDEDTAEWFGHGKFKGME